VWLDYKPFAARPFADRQVWVGYDPAETTDSAGLVVVAPPLVPGGKEGQTTANTGIMEIYS